MDVVLLTSILSNTNRLYRPWGAYQLAWHLREHGYEVQVLDFLHKFDKAKILKLIEKFIAPETKVVGWNCMFMPGHEKWWVKMICEEIIPTLRRRYPQVRFVTGNKILRILKSKGLAPDLPEDIYFLIKKAVSIRKHLERNRKDRDAKFRLILIESRIHRLARYYKTKGVLAPTWKYESSTASALVS